MSSKKTMDYNQAVQDLGAQVEKTRGSIKNKERCAPYLLIISGVLPVFVFLILFFLSPGFVQTEDDEGQYVRSTKKVFYWTLIFSVLLWIGLYLYSWCKGGKNPMLCYKN